MRNLSKKLIESPLNRKASAISSVIGELKYRSLYISLAAISLLLISYLNIGLYIEFQGSYYLNYYQFIDFNWVEGVKELNQNAVSFKGGQDQLPYHKTNPYSFHSHNEQPLQNIFENNVNKKNLYEAILVEIDEFKNFFISITSYFSGQIKFIIDLPENNAKNLFNKEISQQLVLSIYVMSLFYQLSAFSGYHCFCFLCSAVTKQDRLKLIRLLQVFFIILLLHFLLLPYVISIYQEFQIENIDSELFFSSQFGFLEDWTKCFYFLLIAVVMLFFLLIAVAKF